MMIGILVILYLCFGLLSYLAFSVEQKWLARASTALGLLTAVVHGIVLIMRGVEAGHWPFTNTYETLVLLSFLVIVLYFLTFHRYHLLVVGGFAGLVVASLLALTSLLSADIEPLLPALKSNWLLFHVLSAFLGYAAFALATASAVVYLCLHFFSTRFFAHLERRQQTLQEMLGYLDWLTYRLIAGGFAFLTLGIALGAVWANASWGRYWNWDPKETWAFITWVVYGICLHMRCDERCHGTQTALTTIAGFTVIMFTYFGVNFWLASLHAYG